VRRQSPFLHPEFRPTKCLDAIEQRRASIFIGVPAMYRMLLRPRQDRVCRRCAAWLGGRRHASLVASKFNSPRRTRSLPTSAAIVAACSFEGYGMVESVRRRGAQASPPMLNSGSASRSGSECPGYNSRSSTTTQRGRSGKSAKLLLRGSWGDEGLLGDTEASAAALHRGRLAAHRRLARKGMLSRSCSPGSHKGRDQHCGYLGVRPRGRAACSRNIPYVLEAAVLGVLRRSQRRGPVRGGASRRTRRFSTRTR